MNNNTDYIFIDIDYSQRVSEMQMGKPIRKKTISNGMTNKFPIKPNKTVNERYDRVIESKYCSYSGEYTDEFTEKFNEICNKFKKNEASTNSKQKTEKNQVLYTDEEVNSDNLNYNPDTESKIVEPNEKMSFKFLLNP